MSFNCSIELVGGENECKDLLVNHNIVTIVATDNGKVVDKFNATIEDLVATNWTNTRISEHTAYLKLKTYLAQKSH